MNLNPIVCVIQIIIRQFRYLQQQLQMEAEHLDCKNVKKYAKLSLNKRKRLVAFVVEEGYLISKAAHKLNIKLSTAKLIVNRFRRDGTYFQSKKEKIEQERRMKNQSKSKHSQYIHSILFDSTVPKQSSNSNYSSIQANSVSQINPFTYFSMLQFPFYFIGWNTF